MTRQCLYAVQFINESVNKKTPEALITFLDGEQHLVRFIFVKLSTKKYFEIVYFEGGGQSNTLVFTSIVDRLKESSYSLPGYIHYLLDQHNVETSNKVHQNINNLWVRHLGNSKPERKRLNEQH